MTILPPLFPLSPSFYLRPWSSLPLPPFLVVYVGDNLHGKIASKEEEGEEEEGGKEFVFYPHFSPQSDLVKDAGLYSAAEQFYVCSFFFKKRAF